MKRSILLKGLTFGVTFGLTFALMNSVNAKKEQKVSGSHEYIIKYGGVVEEIGTTYYYTSYHYTVYTKVPKLNLSIIEDDMDKKYSNKNDYNFEGCTYTCLVSKNLCQAELNRVYMDINGIKPIIDEKTCLIQDPIDGTCVEVASTIATIFYNNDYRSDVYTRNDSKQTIFNKTLDVARANGYFTFDDNGIGAGTHWNAIPQLFTQMFRYYSSIKTWSQNETDIYSLLKREIDKGKVAGFMVPTHATICTGYLTAKYSYKENNKKVIKEDKYLILNDGQQDDDYAFYSCDYLGNCGCDILSD